MQHYGRLTRPPIFMPSVGRFAQGMIVQLPLQLDAKHVQRCDMSGRPAGLWQIRFSWQLHGENYYYEQPLVLESGG